MGTFLDFILFQVPLSLLICFDSSQATFHPQTYREQFLSSAQQDKYWLITIKRQIHENPELRFEELKPVLLLEMNLINLVFLTHTPFPKLGLSLKLALVYLLLLLFYEDDFLIMSDLDYVLFGMLFKSIERTVKIFPATHT